MQVKIMYGTAWKEDRTKGLVKQAIESGYRAIDTANQRKHYNEIQVGEAVQDWINQGNQRSDIFLQSKFTYIEGQDHRLPYDPQSPISEQVFQSFESSLEHFNTDYLDSFVLHGPSRYDGLIDRDWEVWKSMEKLYKEGKAKSIGVSNVGINHVKELFEKAEIKPQWVQNRCFAQTKWDQSVRRYCIENNIQYQGFSLLTANSFMFQHPVVHRLASEFNKTLAQIIFRFSHQAGMVPLTGTTDVEHMQEDMDIWDFEIPENDVRAIEEVVLK